MSPYAPAKIDLGGLLLGAIIGVGSILIIPKLLYILSGTYGAYARSKLNICKLYTEYIVVVVQVIVMVVCGILPKKLCSVT